MNLPNIKKMKSEQGFTIVELLIVIVVIGILAAIIIVAYIGVTNKANQASAKGNAEGVQKAAEVYNTDNGAYAVDYNALKAGSTTTKLPANVTLINTVPTVANKDGKTIEYLINGGNNGACIVYWDAVANGIGYVFAGGAGTFASGTNTCT